jgi:hypothetical protein
MEDFTERYKMATLNLNKNEIEVTVRESDEYTESVYVRLDRLFPKERRGCNEMFLTPSDLEFLGRFLVRQADEIRTAQEFRKK